MVQLSRFGIRTRLQAGSSDHLQAGMGPPRPMQTAAGLAVCCGLLQTAADRIFDKYFDHMIGPGCQHSKMAASSSGGAAAGSQAAVMAQGYKVNKENILISRNILLLNQGFLSEKNTVEQNFYILQRNKG